MIDLRAMFLTCVCLLGSSSAALSSLGHHDGLLGRSLKTELKKAALALPQGNSDELNNAAMAFLWAFPLVNSE